VGRFWCSERYAEPSATPICMLLHSGVDIVRASCSNTGRIFLLGRTKTWEQNCACTRASQNNRNPNRGPAWTHFGSVQHQRPILMGSKSGENTRPRLSIFITRHFRCSYAAAIRRGASEEFPIERSLPLPLVTRRSLFSILFFAFSSAA
jgi:hypothetical protein